MPLLMNLKKFYFSDKVMMILEDTLESVGFRKCVTYLRNVGQTDSYNKSLNLRSQQCKIPSDSKIEDFSKTSGAKNNPSKPIIYSQLSEIVEISEDEPPIQPAENHLQLNLGIAGEKEHSVMMRTDSQSGRKFEYRIRPFEGEFMKKSEDIRQTDRIIDSQSN